MTRFFRLIAVLLGLGFVVPASATFHLWQISEIYSSADGNVQYVELVALAGGQQFLTGHSITASRTPPPGSNNYNFLTDLPGDTAGKRMLIATERFASLHIVTPDYVVPDGFLFAGGGAVNFAGVDTVNHGALPTDNRSIDRNGTPGTPTPTNFAGQVGFISPECLNGLCAELSVSHLNPPTSSTTGRDVIYRLEAVNAGPAAATNVMLTDILPLGTTFIWASPGCSHSSGTVTCALGNLAAGARPQVMVVVRPGAGAVGPITNAADIGATQLDQDIANNHTQSTHTVAASPPTVPIARYRLYSDGTKEHLFTTDVNEYNVLGASGAWTQEGTAGSVLINPGSFNGVEGVPYYRLYDANTAWHHWTTDANEYYTLGLFSNWHNEGVDGFILPTNTAGATELFRLNYPAIPGLHHWTIDPVEYNQLITNFGWIGEPGAGFVVQ